LTKVCVDSCKQYGFETSEKGRAQLLTLMEYSCPQIQEGMAATMQRSSPRTGSARTPSTRTNDDAELDQLDKEANDLDTQLDKDSEELERRSHGPVRRADPPARSPAPPARAPPTGRRVAPSETHWTCNAEGLSVYGFDVEHGGGDVRGRSTVSIPASGRSRDEAAYHAMSSCGALMTTNLTGDRARVVEASPEGQWGVSIQVACHVTKCAPM
jgi:hypothetical protein